MKRSAVVAIAVACSTLFAGPAVAARTPSPTTQPTVAIAVEPTERPAVYIERCRRQIQAWIRRNQAFYEDADVTINCVWKPGRFSGVYTSATRVVTINPWGMFHWGVRPGPFYNKILTHEVAHAWGDVDGRLKGREARYAEIRGIPVGEVVEDYAETIAVDRGCCYVSWGDPRHTFIWLNRLTYEQLDTLHNEGFLPRW